MSDVDPDKSRRGFLKGVVLAGAAAGAAPAQAAAPPASAAPAAPVKLTPAQVALAAERETAAAEEIGAANNLKSKFMVSDPGSDFILDCLRALGIEFIAVNPGGSTSGLHESIINYGGNKNPELISVTHEEIGTAMAHGYFKATGKPMAALYYGNIGLMHASMAVYNAYADRVPMIILAGNRLNAESRPGGADWQHASIDLEPILSGSIKWYDSPITLTGLAESLGRAYRIAMTEPMGPVLISIDVDLQEKPCSPPRAKLVVPKYRGPEQAVASPEALAAAASLLTAAEYPVLLVNRATDSQAGMDNIVRLAELLGAPVLNKTDRLCMPNRHPLNLTGMDRAVSQKADVLFFLGEDDIWSVIYNESPMDYSTTRSVKANVKTISLGTDDYAAGKNLQDQLRFYPVDLPIVGSPEHSVPGLIEAVQRAMTPEAKARIDARTPLIHQDHQKILTAARAAAAYGWDASPVSTARLCAEMYDAIKDEDWALVSASMEQVGNAPRFFWNMDRYYRFRGRHGAGGLGYNGPASVGAALGHSKAGRFPVSIQTDGDMMYASACFWTAAHHSIPLLSVMHNNQAYHAELMNIQRTANRRNRGITNAHIGCTMTKPEIDFAMMVKSLGVWSAGPISNPADLRPALKKAVQVVKAGEPALIDVRTQPR